MLHFIAIASVILCTIGSITSLLTFLVSIVSWAVIPRWRTIKNYAFLNVNFAFNAIYFLPIMLISSKDVLSEKILYIGLDIAVNFFMFSACCWLMILAVLFYTDLVTVFNANITRKFLKSNVFGYGIPTLLTVVKVVSKILFLTDLIFMPEYRMGDTDWGRYHKVFYYEEIGQNMLLFTLLMINFSVYVRVVQSLMKTPTFRRSANHNQKLQVATLAFVMSGVLMLMSVLMTLLMLFGTKDNYYLYPIGLGLYGIQTTVINVCFLRSKANRSVWTQYLENMRRVKTIRSQEKHELAKS